MPVKSQDTSDSWFQLQSSTFTSNLDNQVSKILVWTLPSIHSSSLFSPGALPIIHITLLCYPAVRQAALLAYILLSAYGIYCATTARTNILRLRAFVWQGLFRFSLFLFRVYGSGVGSPDSLRLFVIMDSLAVLGGLVNIIQIPERFIPGRFDNWGNSHQIMHIMVICAIIYLHWGTLEDLSWIKTYQCPAGWCEKCIRYICPCTQGLLIEEI